MIAYGPTLFQTLIGLSAFVMVGSAITPRRLQSLAMKFPSNVNVVAVVCDLNGTPGFRELSGIKVMTVAILDDFKGLMARTAA